MCLLQKLIQKHLFISSNPSSYDTYVGRCLIGKVESGNAEVNKIVKAINLNQKLVEKGKLTKLFSFQGNKRIPVNEIVAGDIACIAGLTNASVSDTICDNLVSNPIKSSPIDPPTMSITITVNNSPFAGQEGKKVTSNNIRERLLAEAETNVAITFSENENKDAFEIGGRGELQLGVLIENYAKRRF